MAIPYPTHTPVYGIVINTLYSVKIILYLLALDFFFFFYDLAVCRIVPYMESVMSLLFIVIFVSPVKEGFFNI